MHTKTIVAIIIALAVAIAIGGAALVAAFKLVLTFLMFGMMVSG